MQKRRQIRALPDVEIGPSVDAKVREMIAVGDRDLQEIRVNFRWRRGQLAIVKRAAEAYGVPYQTYMKQVVFKQALADCRPCSASQRSRSPRIVGLQMAVAARLLPIA